MMKKVAKARIHKTNSNESMQKRSSDTYSLKPTQKIHF